MITKEEFLEFVRRTGADTSDIDRELNEFDRIATTAYKVQRMMPGIGFTSVSGRLNCFLAVCRHLDSLIDLGEIDLSESQIVLMILRVKDKKFLKAITMFDTRANRLGVRERAELPASAREYLAGLLMYG